VTGSGTLYGVDPAERVRRDVGAEVVHALESLSNPDLTALLLPIAAVRATATPLARLLQDNRFTRPSTADPRAIAALEHRLWQALPEQFEGVELSPLAPQGTYAAAGVHQNQVVTTMRGHEVVSDATNVLALEAARRRGTRDTVHLAAAHRVIRAQQFGPGAGAHFRLFNLVSSARDRGSGRTEADLLLAHLQAWGELLAGLPVTFGLTVFREGAVAERLRDTVLPQLDLTVTDVPERHGRGYYEEVAFKIHLGDVELGDGGLTRWTAKLRHDAKERCLISCVSTERLALALP
jgi:hypothetical protein